MILHTLVPTESGIPCMLPFYMEIKGYSNKYHNNCIYNEQNKLICVTGFEDIDVHNSKPKTSVCITNKHRLIYIYIENKLQIYILKRLKYIILYI